MVIELVSYSTELYGITKKELFKALLEHFPESASVENQSHFLSEFPKSIAFNIDQSEDKALYYALQKAKALVAIKQLAFHEVIKAFDYIMSPPVYTKEEKYALAQIIQSAAAHNRVFCDMLTASLIQKLDLLEQKYSRSPKPLFGVAMRTHGVEGEEAAALDKKTVMTTSVFHFRDKRARQEWAEAVELQEISLSSDPTA